MKFMLSFMKLSEELLLPLLQSVESEYTLCGVDEAIIL